MHKILLTSFTLVTLISGSLPVLLSSQPATAQGTCPSFRPLTRATSIRTPIPNLSRAKNYARQAAEAANGGIGKYRAENSMHGQAMNAPFVENSDGTITFTFLGCLAPGFSKATVESQVTVNPNGWRTTVNYNGPIRSSGNSTGTGAR
ncbi:hypothetical protein [Pantanalinema sp. GBBB05]|uniref:hypothetical protein n=1 Tax=Pantanalinema sp. GBBB05 TaxID=2604139 RepID=UPI001D34279D|nr:hypothetical protein [Pantanalinema sp. GBBB05]